MTSDLGQFRAALRDRLQTRRGEIEGSILTRVFAIADPTDAEPAYREGLRAAVSTAVEYAFEAIERGEEREPPPPPTLLIQARMAARSHIGLDVVLRRYLAGYALLSECLVEEAEKDGLARRLGLGRVLRGQAALFDRLLAVVADEYRRESVSYPTSTEARLRERVERLLAGEPIDPSGLEYDFEVHHTGLVAAGPGAAEAIRERLTGFLDCRLLVVRRDEASAWAWLGSRRGLDASEVGRLLGAVGRGEITFALGEPGRGLSGWRLTHRQAVAALQVAQRLPNPVARYADVALLASVLRDDLLVDSLRELYLLPLAGDRDGGAGLRETLRAYFAADRNISSAAAALGVNRNTITSRLRVAEDHLGRSLAACRIELETALQLDCLDDVGEASPGGHPARSRARS